MPPEIIPMPEISVIDGETASVVCNATGKPPPSYSWIKDSTRADLSVTNRFTVKKESGLLIINDVKYEDGGLYTCIATNPAAKVETKVKINVLIKPKIYELLNITAPVGTNTKIICKASGRPPPKITFRKTSNPEPFYIGEQREDRRIHLEQTNDLAKGESIGILNIRDLRRSDDGLYECIAENKVNVAVHKGHITVEFKPTFEKVKDYPPVWIWDNKVGNLSCIAESIPNATITWKFGGTELKNGTSNIFTIYGKGPVSNLIITPFSEKRFYGKYECIATNKLGDTTHWIELKLAFKPEPVQQTSIDFLTATTVKFFIVGPQNLHGLPVRAFVVFYLPAREINWQYARNHTWSYGITSHLIFV